MQRIRRRTLAVLGPGDANESQMVIAETVGRLAAEHAWVVLTGGGPGVMTAACRGAVEAGGLTVGVLPGARAGDGYPNHWVVIPIYTGLGMARNAVNVLSATLCVAIGGGPGTLSEIALALKSGVEVWCLDSWGLEPPPATDCAMPRRFDSPEDLLEALNARFEADS